jgi:hypothetical protein
MKLAQRAVFVAVASGGNFAHNEPEEKAVQNQENHAATIHPNLSVKKWVRDVR